MAWCKLILVKEVRACLRSRRANAGLFEGRAPRRSAPEATGVCRARVRVPYSADLYDPDDDTPQTGQPKVAYFPLPPETSYNPTERNGGVPRRQGKELTFQRVAVSIVAMSRWSQQARKNLTKEVGSLSPFF